MSNLIDSVADSLLGRVRCNHSGSDCDKCLIIDGVMEIVNELKNISEVQAEILKSLDAIKDRLLDR